MERCLELLNSEDMKSLENRKLLFNNPLYRPYLLLTYHQFKQIFRVEEDNLPRLNKMIIYGEVDFYNYVYNQVWAFKWYPLIFKFFLNTIRRRPTSIFLSFIYIASLELFLERFLVFQYIDQKMVDVSNYFTVPLCKKYYIAKQDELFQRYKEAIVNDLTKEKYYETEFKPREWVILGNKFNIHNPYIHWTESREQKEQDILKEFFIQNNQIPLLISRFQRMFRWCVQASSEEKSNSLQQLFATIKTTTRRVVLEFPAYKDMLPIIPTCGKMNEILNYEAIDQRKRFFGFDEYKFLLSKTMNVYKFYAEGKNEFVRYEFKWFDPNISAKKPTYKVENYWYDFLAFSVICLIPAKFFRFRQTMQNIKRMRTIVGME